jgi:RNA polymerase sigma-70 factor (ECF subfamily)
LSREIAFPGRDNELNIEALQRQDALEFERLYQIYAPGVRLYIRRLCGDSELADDLLQETFVKAYRALPRTRPDLSPRPWLYKIATNMVRSTLRLTQWKRVLPFSIKPPEEQPDNQTMENDYAEAELVERALATIKPEYAAPLLLHWREGFSIEEAGVILGLSKENLKKRLYRAKKAFGEAYTRECARTEGGSY